MTEHGERSGEDREIWTRFRHHSRTFSLAALFLPPRVRLPVATLYLFCRRVDEIADRLAPTEGTDAALRQLERVSQSLDLTLRGAAPEETLWLRLQEVHREFGLNEEPMKELIEGARWDVEGRMVRDEADLVRYSDLVGGTIGAMMLPLLGLGDDSDAETRARDLGIGMQITNIVRDVGEDTLVLRRSYIPVSLSDRLGVDPGAIDPGDRRYRLLMEDLMTLAENYYVSGISGISLLPAPMRPGIHAATRFYREILNEVRANGYDNVSRRAFTSGLRKAASLLPGHYHRRKSRLVRRHA